MKLTLLYYSAGRISDGFSSAVRAELLSAASDVPVVSVTHSPMPSFGHNICVGPVEPSIWQCYQNILTAAKAATTWMVACCEDDSLYVPEHFTYRPALDTFAYNLNRWVITRRLSDDRKSRQPFYYFRNRTQMAQCIAPRDLLIETLEERFAKCPEPISHDEAKRSGWGEPGRYEKNLGLTPRKLEYFRTSEPNVTFNHSNSLMGRRAVKADDLICDDLPPWGNASALWDRIHG